MSKELDYILQKFNIENFMKPPIYLPMSRWNDFPALLSELNYEVGAEIGVGEGIYSEHLLKNIPGLRLYCVDPWECYLEYNEVSTSERMATIYETALDRLRPYPRCQIIRKESVKAANDIPNNYLDFVFIDGNHEFLHVTQDIYYWERKVRRGGIVAGHDFHRKRGRGYVCHVKDVVQAWAYAHGISPWFIFRGNDDPCWFWVRL